MKAVDFFEAWRNAAKDNESDLLAAWTHNDREYTRLALTAPDSVITRTGDILGLKCYNQNYYSIDSILYRDEDRVPNVIEGSFWLKHIPVAFEHENNCDDRLYQEVSHLLITRADLRVLVTYPGQSKDYVDKVLHRQHALIQSSPYSKEISDLENFLVILGVRRTDYIEWSALIFKEHAWSALAPCNT